MASGIFFVFDASYHEAATSFHESSSVLCFGSSAFLIVDSTFHRQWHAFRVRCQPPCSGKFACLGNHRSHVVLPLIKLHKQGATTVLPSCPCYFTHLGKNHNFGTATTGPTG